jgi:hypothetical protein
MALFTVRGKINNIMNDREKLLLLVLYTGCGFCGGIVLAYALCMFLFVSHTELAILILLIGACGGLIGFRAGQGTLSH